MDKMTYSAIDLMLEGLAESAFQSGWLTARKRKRMELTPAEELELRLTTAEWMNEYKHTFEDLKKDPEMQ